MILKKKQWKKEEVQILLDMKKNKFSLKKISDTLQVTVNAISKALSRYSTEYISVKKIGINNNSFLKTIEWFNQYNHQVKIKKHKQGFYIGKEYFSAVSIKLILNKCCQKYQREMINI
jgi:predicted transcriptional regulator